METTILGYSIVLGFYSGLLKVLAWAHDGRAEHAQFM